MRFVPLLLLLLACAHAPPSTPASAPPVCVNRGLLPEDLFKRGGVLVLGEFHGTRQSQQAVDDVVCQGLVLGHDVRVVLEIPKEETARVDSFLAGGRREELLAGDFWRRDYQDGRSSQAMFGLIERVRAMRGAGLPVSVVLMDSVAPGADRDAYMAEQVVAAHERSPQALLVVLVGNIHARTRLSLPRSTAWRVKQAGVPLTSVLLEYGDGVAWVCGQGSADSCGAHALAGKQNGPPRPFEAEENPSATGFDGQLYLGPMEASPPAVSGQKPVSSASPASPPPEASPASLPRPGGPR